MKTAICIDSLIKRDDSIFLVELILNLFPDSEIYTIAHQQGGILGQIETRPIVSSYLSHRAKSPDVFRKNFWVLPSAVKGIPLHKSIEKVIIISRGYIHGLNLPAHVKKLLYVYDWDLVPAQKLGWQKLFAPYVHQWREAALVNFPKIAVSSEALQRELHLPNAEIIQPTFRTEEFPFVKDEDHNFLFTHHLVHTTGLEAEEFECLATVLLAKGETLRLMGPTAHLDHLRGRFPQVDFVGDHCEATTALYSHQAKAVWCLGTGPFPSFALGALCTGRPAVVRDNPVNREFLTAGAFFLGDVTEQNLSTLLSEIEGSYLCFDRRARRRLGLQWNDRLFKSRMVKFLERSL